MLMRCGLRCALVLVALILPAANYGQNTAKKLIVFDFQNLSGDKNYTYLEDSITEAVRTFLKERFVYQETDRAVWAATLKENNFFLKDIHTESIGLSLGLIMKQDAVINGSFTVTPSKKKDSEPTIVTTVNIFDIRNRRILTTFQVSGPADSRIFDSVQRIARNIADEARPLLPNRDDYEKGKYVEEFETALYRHNLLMLRGGIAPVGFPQAGGVLAAETKLSIADITAAIPVSVEYQRLAIMGNLFLFGRLGYQFGSRNYETDPYKTSATGSLSSFQAAVGPGLLIPVSFIGRGRIFTKIQAAAIYSEASITLQVPGAEPRKLSASAPGAGLLFALGFSLTQRLSIELCGDYSHFFYKDASAGIVSAQVGVGLRI